MEEQEYTQETYETENQEQTYEQPDTYEQPEGPVETISNKERNFRNLEEDRNRWKQRAEELEAKYQAQTQASYQAPSSQYDPDDIADRRYVDSRINELSIRYKYPDYDQVVNTKTIERLKQEDPYLAYSIGSNPDSYSQSIAVYNAIKRYGLATDDYQKHKELAHNNVNKPRPSNAVAPQRGESPLSHAHAFADGPLTDQQLDALRKEMDEARKRR